MSIHSPPINSAVQIFRSAFHLAEKVAKSTKSIRETGFSFSQPKIIRHYNDVNIG